MILNNSHVADFPDSDSLRHYTTVYSTNPSSLVLSASAIPAECWSKIYQSQQDSLKPCPRTDLLPIIKYFSVGEPEPVKPKLFTFRLYTGPEPKSFCFVVFKNHLIL